MRFAQIHLRIKPRKAPQVFTTQIWKAAGRILLSISIPPKGVSTAIQGLNQSDIYSENEHVTCLHSQKVSLKVVSAKTLCIGLDNLTSFKKILLVLRVGG